MTGSKFHASFKLLLPDFKLEPEFEMGSEMAVLFGASGAGKTLTLRALAGLLKPDRGHIRLNGHSLYDSSQEIDLPPQDRGIGYVPQHYALFPHQSIAKNIAFGLNDLTKSERQERVAELLGRMRLKRLADRKPGEVSGGQQQRTAVARALARRPDLLLLDEPFAAVEEDLRAHLREELLRIQMDFEMPMLLVTHSRAEAYALAKRLIVLSEGKVVQSGSRDEVFRRPTTPTVARLMGMTNILEVAASEGAAKWEGFDLTLPGINSQGTVMVGIRPEEIRVLAAGQNWHEINRISGRLVKDEPQGADHGLQFQINDQLLDVRISHPEFMNLELAAGQERTLAIVPEALHIISQP